MGLGVGWLDWRCGEGGLLVVGLVGWRGGKGKGFWGWFQGWAGGVCWMGSYLKVNCCDRCVSKEKSPIG